jgi:hypothetical protein
VVIFKLSTVDQAPVVIVGSEALQREDGAAVISLVQQIADTAKAQVKYTSDICAFVHLCSVADPHPDLHWISIQQSFRSAGSGSTRMRIRIRLNKIKRNLAIFKIKYGTFFLDFHLSFKNRH